MRAALSWITQSVKLAVVPAKSPTAAPYTVSRALAAVSVSGAKCAVAELPVKAHCAKLTSRSAGLPTCVSPQTAPQTPTWRLASVLSGVARASLPSKVHCEKATGCAAVCSLERKTAAPLAKGREAPALGRLAVALLLLQRQRLKETGPTGSIMPTAPPAAPLDWQVAALPSKTQSSKRAKTGLATRTAAAPQPPVPSVLN